jgi:hypothetical protein
LNARDREKVADVLEREMDFIIDTAHFRQHSCVTVADT